MMQVKKKLDHFTVITNFFDFLLLLCLDVLKYLEIQMMALIFLLIALIFGKEIHLEILMNILGEIIVFAMEDIVKFGDVTIFVFLNL